MATPKKSYADKLHSDLKVVFVTFSCSRDAEMVKITSKTIKGGEHYIVDEQEDKVKGVHNVISREFDRGTTLDGIDSVVGQIQVYKELIGDADYIVKVDSDVIMLGDRFLQDLATKHFAHYGSRIDLMIRDKEGNDILKNRMAFAKGGVYAISKAALSRLPDDRDELVHQLMIANEKVQGALGNVRTNGIAFAEDECVSRLLFEAYNGDMERLCWQHEGSSGLMAHWDFRRYKTFNPSALRRYHAYDFIHVRKTARLDQKEFPTKEMRYEHALALAKDIVGAL